MTNHLKMRTFSSCSIHNRNFDKGAALLFSGVSRREVIRLCKLVANSGSMTLSTFRPTRTQRYLSIIASHSASSWWRYSEILKLYVERWFLCSNHLSVVRVCGCLGEELVEIKRQLRLKSRFYIQVHQIHSLDSAPEVQALSHLIETGHLETAFMPNLQSVIDKGFPLPSVFSLVGWQGVSRGLLAILLRLLFVDRALLYLK